MALAAAPSLAWMRARAASRGLPAIWTGLGLFMALRAALGLGRFWSYTGPFAALRPPLGEKLKAAGGDAAAASAGTSEHGVSIS